MGRTNPDGCAAIRQRLASYDIQSIVVEATGRYERALVAALAANPTTHWQLTWLLINIAKWVSRWE